MDTLLFLALFGGIFAVIIGTTIHQRRQLAKKRSWNYQWYSNEFPQLVKNGRVTCYQCGGSSVGVERLMNQTYLRAHICRQCGTTLYYSSES